MLAFAFLMIIGVFTATAAELKLDDGSVIRGEILSLTDSVVAVRTQSLGDVLVMRSRIVAGLDESDSPSSPPIRGERYRQDPAGYALFFLPTAFTPPQGTKTFRDFELFFLNFGYSPTSSTVVSGGFLFPITTEFQLLTLGVKQQLFQTQTGTAMAITGNITIPVSDDAEGSLYNGNLLFSHRVAEGRYEDAFGVHAALGYWKGTESEEGAFTLGAGAEVRLTANAKFIAEYYGPTEEPEVGFMTLGFRLHGDKLSADIAGVRPLEAEGGDFLFFPLLVVNYRF